MTLLILDGFDALPADGNPPVHDWDSWGVYSTSGTSTRFGVGSYIKQAVNAELAKTLPSPAGEVVFGGGYTSDAGAGHVVTIHTFYDGATKQATITADSDGTIHLRRGNSSGTSVAQTAAGVYTHNFVWQGLSFRVKWHGSAGQFQVWKNGASVLNASGLNTITSANPQIDKLCVGGDGNGSWYSLTDDFYAFIVDGVTPNAFPGDVRVYTLYPSANDSVTWSHSGVANNYQALKSGYSLWYNFSSNVGDIDMFAFDDMPGGWLGVIIAAKMTMRAWKDDAGVRQIRSRLNSGGTIYSQPTITLTTAAISYVCDYLLVDPFTSAAWAGASAINALKAGYELVA